MTMRKLSYWIPIALAVALAMPAEASRNYISGQVIDRNGKPVERAIVTLAPGNVQLVTDSEGKFLIDYLRDDAGQRMRLARKVDYQLEVFKPGYHTESLPVHYKRGAVAVDPFTLKEDTIEVTDDDKNIDPGLFSDRSQSGGATYEGQ
jgi:hypothetical protein